MRNDVVLITCEHGGNKVPADYADLFAGHKSLLESHRGWDPGALELAQEMAAALRAPLFVATTTRLLVDLNRSIGHRQLHSEFTRPLSLTAREKIISCHYLPHRGVVEAAIAQHIGDGARVVHIASHSFTPELNGHVRRADAAWLYDTARLSERALSVRWQAAMKHLQPELVVRRNYPYRGNGDGLTRLMRQSYPEEQYVGIELEVNQRHFMHGGPKWQQIKSSLIASVKAVTKVTPEA
jgi:predicted N-formylglutamate amidohydrolase